MYAILTFNRAMQDCFRQYPEVYGSELEEDAEPEAESPAEDAISGLEPSVAVEKDISSHPEEKRARAKEVNAQMKAKTAEQSELPESEALLPKASHDADHESADQ